MKTNNAIATVMFPTPRNYDIKEYCIISNGGVRLVTTDGKIIHTGINNVVIVENVQE